MLTDAAMRHVGSLVDAVADDPHRLPLGELLRVSELGMHVSIDRTRSAPVVFVGPRREPVFQNLTARELDVVTLVAAGFSNAQVASALFVSTATVKDHLHSAYAKSGLKSRAQVIAAWYGGRREPV